MYDLIPKVLRDALKGEIEYFMIERCEWKLKLEESASFIEQVVKGSVCAFANNRYGDYLFLKKNDDTESYGEDVYEYLHEGPEVLRLEDRLELLLGLEAREPSDDGYPKAV